MKTKEIQTRLLAPCRNPDELNEWVRLFVGYNIPRTSVCDCHDAPFEYLAAAYFEPAEDLIVWAPRGGGKTRLAALATLLDLLHKPRVAVRILGGSLEQSMKMWEHLVPDLERLAGDQLKKRIAQGRRLRLRGGSTCAVLTQSQRAVRGLRVQKLRCDEVELFDPDVWEAAQLVTRSFLPLPVLREGGRGESRSAISRSAQDTTQEIRAHRILPLPYPSPGVPEEGVRGTIEALSTHHRPFGLMGKLLDLAQSQQKPRVIKWCILDVLQRCEPDRDCKTCALWDDCGGVAKTRCEGFIPIGDAIALKQRVSRECWDAEMLCRRPSVRGCVFPGFDVGTHVKEELPVASCQLPVKKGRSDASSPTGNCQLSTSNFLTIDFGFANPFVCLWIRGAGTGDRAIVHVIDEYVQAGQTIDVHLQQMQSRPHGRPEWVACDPAGNARSDQTAASNVSVLRAAGYRVRYRASRIVDGIEMIRSTLRPAAGTPRLAVHPRCVRLIAALRGYRYPDPGSAGASSELPLKDGEHDHLVDALRYFFVNNIERRVIVSNY